MDVRFALRRTWGSLLDWYNRWFIDPGWRDTDHRERIVRRKQIDELDFRDRPVRGLELLSISPTGTVEDKAVVRSRYSGWSIREIIDILDDYKKRARMNPNTRRGSIERYSKLLLEKYTNDEISSELDTRIRQAEKDLLGLNEAYCLFDVDEKFHVEFQMPSTPNFGQVTAEGDAFPSESVDFTTKSADMKTLRVGFDLLSDRTVSEQVRSWAIEKSSLMDFPPSIRIDRDSNNPFYDVVAEGHRKVLDEGFYPDTVIVPQQMNHTVLRDDDFFTDTEDLRDDVAGIIAGMEVVFDDTGALNGSIAVVDTDHFGYRVESRSLHKISTSYDESKYRFAFGWMGNYVTIQDDAMVLLQI